MNKLRLLDFDDLLILRHLQQGETLSAAARLMGLTQPAVTQRVRKIESVLGISLLEKHGRHARLTPYGSRIARKMQHILELLEEVEAEPTIEVIDLGVPIDSFIMQVDDAVLQLRSTQPDVHYNIINGRESDLARQLASRRIGAILATSSAGGRDISALPIREIEFSLVTGRDSQFPGTIDPSTQTFIEYPGAAASLIIAATPGTVIPKFKEIWRVSDAAAAVKASEAGLGVTLVPKKYLVRKADLSKIREISLVNAQIQPLQVFLHISADERGWQPYDKIVALLKGADVEKSGETLAGGTANPSNIDL